MDKPGVYTTEFWIAAASQVVAVLALAGVIKPSDQHTLLDALTNAITALGVVIASAHVVAHYIKSRTTIKVNS